MAGTFDTLKAARELEAAGIERRQAEAITETAREAAAADRTQLATKAELYRALLLQAGIIIAAVVALLKLLP